eukprot:354908-Chlamydomonas_euryale.AAC.6
MLMPCSAGFKVSLQGQSRLVVCSSSLAGVAPACVRRNGLRHGPWRLKLAGSRNACSYLVAHGQVTKPIPNMVTLTQLHGHRAAAPPATSPRRPCSQSPPHVLVPPRRVRSAARRGAVVGLNAMAMASPTAPRWFLSISYAAYVAHVTCSGNEAWNEAREWDNERGTAYAYTHTHMRTHTCIAKTP